MNWSFIKLSQFSLTTIAILSKLSMFAVPKWWDNDFACLITFHRTLLFSRTYLGETFLSPLSFAPKKSNELRLSNFCTPKENYIPLIFAHLKISLKCDAIVSNLVKPLMSYRQNLVCLLFPSDKLTIFACCSAFHALLYISFSIHPTSLVNRRKIISYILIIFP